MRPRKPPATALAALLASIVTLTAAATGPLAMAQDDWTSFEFEAYNREYVDLRTSTRWERRTPILATVTSPSHRLSIRDHTVDLRPAPNGTYETRVRVNFSGEGEIVAEIGGAGATRLEDRVSAPLQEVQVNARIRFRSVEGGYEVDTVEMQESVEVAIESELGGRIVELCRSALALLGADCRGVRAMFSSATIDLPEAGGSYFIAEDRLSRSERVRLDRFLKRTQPAP
jgi:hypothetical protein